MNQSYETLAMATPRPHVPQVILNRPAVRSAINAQMGRDLLALWSALIVDPGEVRAVLPDVPLHGIVALAGPSNGFVPASASPKTCGGFLSEGATEAIDCERQQSGMARTRLTP